MDSLIMQLQGRKGFLKLTWEDLAERVHKDVSTVKKQLSSRGNPSLSTLNEYAAALDAEIVLLSGDALYDYRQSGVPRAQKSLAEQDREIEHLKEKLDVKDEDIKEYKETIRSLRAQNDRLSALLEVKDTRIEKLTDKVERLTEKLLEK